MPEISGFTPNRTSVLSFSEEQWAAAQTMHSRLGGKCDQTEQTETAKIYTLREKREFSPKKQGLRDNVVKHTKYSRRLLHVIEFDDTDVVDNTDERDHTGDYFGDTEKEWISAAARVRDVTILNGIIQNAVLSYGSEELDYTFKSLGGIGEGATESNASRRIAEFRTQRAARDIVVYDDKVLKASTTTAKKAFEDNTFHRVIRLFGNRLVSEALCATLNPDQAEELRTSEAFQNVENVYSLDKSSVQVDANDSLERGFMYRSIRFIPVFHDILPDIGTHNIASSVTSAGAVLTAKKLSSGTRQHAQGGLFATAESGSKVTVLKRDEQTDTAPLARLVETVPNKAKLTTETAAHYTDVTIEDGTDVMYIWVPKALKYAVRKDLFMSGSDVLPDKGFAKIRYERLAMGATLLDENYACVLVTKGKTA